MQRALYIIPFIVGVWYLDNLASKDRTIGWERNSVFDARKRLRESKARDTILLGSSTSVDWLRPALVEKLFRLPPGAVVDAHVNGCHQGCTFSQVKGLLQQRKHYKKAFFGTNEFQLCEEDHSKRIMQHQMMLPAEDLPELFLVYTEARQPLRNIARYVGITASGVYGDTNFLRRKWSHKWIGVPRRGRDHHWYKKKRSRNYTDHWCGYAEEDVAYKIAFSKALYSSMLRLADDVFIMLLPDQTLSENDPEKRRVWKHHRKIHQEIADTDEHLHLIDLSTNGASLPRHFRDGYHLSGEGTRLQQALLAKLLAQKGWIKKNRR